MCGGEQARKSSQLEADSGTVLPVGPCFERDASVLDVMAEAVPCGARNTLDPYLKLNSM
jgi:hypothetical protein